MFGHREIGGIGGKQFFFFPIAANHSVHELALSLRFSIHSKSEDISQIGFFFFFFFQSAAKQNLEIPNPFLCLTI
jgi:hypothetical protein